MSKREQLGHLQKKKNSKVKACNRIVGTLQILTQLPEKSVHISKYAEHKKK